MVGGGVQEAAPPLLQDSFLVGVPLSVVLLLQGLLAGVKPRVVRRQGVLRPGNGATQEEHGPEPSPGLWSVGKGCGRLARIGR